MAPPIPEACKGASHLSVCDKVIETTELFELFSLFWKNLETHCFYWLFWRGGGVSQKKNETSTGKLPDSSKTLKTVQVTGKLQDSSKTLKTAQVTVPDSSKTLNTLKNVSNTLYSLCLTGDFVTQSASSHFGLWAQSFCDGVYEALNRSLFITYIWSYKIRCFLWLSLTTGNFPFTTAITSWCCYVVHNRWENVQETWWRLGVWGLGFRV